MPRSLRHEYEGAVYHAMCRGNNGQLIFRKDKGFRLFLSTLEDACLQTGWRIHAYVLMSNHYHLLLETPEANLVAGMKWFQGTYTQRFNAMFKCRGHLFQGRYKALPIEAECTGDYFREVGHYIHLNPFRAGVAGVSRDRPLEVYRWSSYPFYAGTARKCPDWLKRDRLLAACGLDSFSRQSVSAYRAIIESRMLGVADAPFVSEVVVKQLSRSWYVGGDSFREKLTSMIGKPSDNLRGEQRRAHDELEAERLLAEALRALAIDEKALLSMKQNSFEKQGIVWLLKRHTTVTGVWLSKRLDMGHRSNVSRAISSFEHAEHGEHGERLRIKEVMMQCTG